MQPTEPMEPVRALGPWTHFVQRQLSHLQPRLRTAPPAPGPTTVPPVRLTDTPRPAMAAPPSLCADGFTRPPAKSWRRAAKMFSFMTHACI